MTVWTKEQIKEKLMTIRQQTSKPLKLPTLIMVLVSMVLMLQSCQAWQNGTPQKVSCHTSKRQSFVKGCLNTQDSSNESQMGKYEWMKVLV